jgi:hypothetical protein
VMVVLPAALLWAEEHGPFALRDLDPRPLLSRIRSARPPRRSWPDRLRAIRPRAFWRRTRA